MFEKMCPVCDRPFVDGDPLVAVMLSEYRAISSEVHFAIEQPTACLEIFHRDCYDGDDRQDYERIKVNG